MFGIKKLVPLLSVALMLCQFPAGADTEAGANFENQSDVGKVLRIPVHHWFDSSRETKAVVVAVPGLVFNGRAYDPLARALASRGYEVYSADMRGYGDWLSAKNGEFDGDALVHYGQSKEDLTRVLQALHSKFIGKPIFCLGESFGANYAVWEATTDPQLVDGVIAAGLSYKICIHPRARWVLTGIQGLARPRTPLKLEPYLVPILSEDKEIALAALEDDQITRRDLSATDLIKATITTKQAIKQVQNIPATMPILVIAGQKDAVQKTNTLPEFVNSLGSKQAHLVVLPGKGHLLFERKGVDGNVVEIVTKWLDSEVQRRSIGTSISFAK